MESKYQKIVLHIRGEIAQGKLKPGCRLPSIREMTEIYSCNKATIIRAYSELEKEHLLYAKPKSGYYVVEGRDISSASAAPSAVIDFTPAAPDTEALPYQEFQHSINKAIDIYKDSLFSYSESQGLPTLRNALLKYLNNYQIFAHPNDVYITTGSQQALFLLAAMPFPNGKGNVLVEQPTFKGMLGALKANNITALGIERTSTGVDLEELERLFKNGSIKFFYTIPRFHNPTGCSYSNEQKKAILSLARKYDVYIVEDDYLSELDPDSKADPFFAFDTTARVIYVKSFSKTLLPGLRIAAVVLPKLLANTFTFFKKSCDLNTSVLSQGALEIYLKSGMFENHIKKIRKLYLHRMEAFAKASEMLRELAVQCTPPGSGLFAYLELPEEIKAQSFIAALNTKNVNASNAEAMFLPSFRKYNCIRLSMCRVDKDKIYEGISIMHDILQHMSGTPAARKSYIDL